MDHQTPDEMKSSRKMSIKDSAMINTPERKLVLSNFSHLTIVINKDYFISMHLSNFIRILTYNSDIPKWDSFWQVSRSAKFMVEHLL